MLMAGLAKTGAWLLASIPIISLWNISMPAAQSMMTHRVSEREQGELQGALAEHAFDHFHCWPVVIPSNFWVVHRSEESQFSFRERTVLSGSRFSFYCNAHVNTHQANTAAITSGQCSPVVPLVPPEITVRLALRRLPKRKKIFEILPA